YRGRRPAVERRIRQALPARTAVRLRGPGETPYLRQGDAVLPQAAIKARFGEFAYRPGPGRDVVQDPRWTAEHIVTARVPILGLVRCHRTLVPALRGALRELRQRNLTSMIDPAGYAGCHNARLTSSGDQVSRHAWGVAIDLNYPDNPVGQASTQDPRLVEVMERWGFTWGGRWLVPDPAHFEYVRQTRGR
ncbi:MAG: M15 family metallopeptidase, partial [Actinomycetota bacterium]|nr:M15 family metallopeptidase [Actinomycetota bacterium]